MTWFYLALICAMSLALADALGKKYFPDYSGVSIMLVRLSLPGLALLPLVFYYWIPNLPLAFWYQFLILVPLELIAMWLYVSAIRDAPLHLTLPYLAFTPVFNILTGYLVLGEVVNLDGALGIILVVIGSYVLNLDQIKNPVRDIFAPFTAIIRLKGSRRMLMAASIYSFTSVYSKHAMQYATPEFFGAIYFVIVGLSLLVIVIFTRPKTVVQMLHRPAASLVVGALMAVMVITHFLAIAQVEVAYMVAVKRSSLLFGILLGAWMFKDVILRQHLPAGMIMLTGVILILI